MQQSKYYLSLTVCERVTLFSSHISGSATQLLPSTFGVPVIFISSVSIYLLPTEGFHMPWAEKANTMRNISCHKTPYFFSPWGNLPHQGKWCLQVWIGLGGGQKIWKGYWTERQMEIFWGEVWGKQHWGAGGFGYTSSVAKQANPSQTRVRWIYSLSPSLFSGPST